MLLYREWLPHQRWYAGRHRELASITPAITTPLRPDLDHVLLDVAYTDGARDRYQVPIVWDQPVEVAAVATIGSHGDRTAYDALYHEPSTRYLLELIAAGARRGNLRFVPEPDAQFPTETTSQVLDAEQSNTSVVFDRTALLKVFRRVLPGLNPDVELNRVLGRAGCPHTAPLLGAIEGIDERRRLLSLGMVSAYAENAADGWSMATASARDLLAELDLHADEVGGDFAAESHRLGEAVAVVHRMLAETLGTSLAPPPGEVLAARLTAAVEAVPELAAQASAARELFAAANGQQWPIQRIHGDLHLGQVLRTPESWLLIDFEGEPGAPMAARRRPDSPLRDVAGMLRSYEYAAYHLLIGEKRDEQLTYHAQEWIKRNQSAFCDGYAEVAGADPRDRPALLAAYELDKAFYEAAYEARHRPSWLWIPLESIPRLLRVPQGAP